MIYVIQFSRISVSVSAFSDAGFSPSTTLRLGGCIAQSVGVSFAVFLWLVAAGIFVVAASVDVRQLLPGKAYPSLPQ
jgi:hypothetical protein